MYEIVIIIKKIITTKKEIVKNKFLNFGLNSFPSVVLIAGLLLRRKIDKVNRVTDSRTIAAYTTVNDAKKNEIMIETKIRHAAYADKTRTVSKQSNSLQIVTKSMTVKIAPSTSR